MPAQPGRFDQWVTIERATRTINDLNESAITGWAPVARVAAEAILPTAQNQNREAALAGRAALERVVTFRMRWPLDIGPADRIVWFDEPYGVEGLVIDRRAGEVRATARYASETDGR